MGNQPLKPIKDGITLLNDSEENKQKKAVAIIFSFVCKGSYDNLFTTVEQKSEEGTKVLTYSCSHYYIANLTLLFEGKPHNDFDR